MDANNAALTTIDGGYEYVGQSYTGDQYYYPYGWPYSITPLINYTYQWPMPVEPQSCIGKAHVFECEHVTQCKCGAVERAMKKSGGKKKC